MLLVLDTRSQQQRQLERRQARAADGLASRWDDVVWGATREVSIRLGKGTRGYGICVFSTEGAG